MKLPLAATIVRVSLAATATVICLEPQTSLLAQNLQDVAEREIVRRQEDLVVAERLIIAGDRALAEKNYDQAISELGQANKQNPANLYLLGEACQGKGDGAQAREWFTKAAKFNSLPLLNYAFVRAKAEKAIAS